MRDGSSVYGGGSDRKGGKWQDLGWTLKVEPTESTNELEGGFERERSQS